MCRCQKVEQRRKNATNPRRFVGLAPSHNTQWLMLYNVYTCPLFPTSIVTSMHNFHSAAAPSAVQENSVLYSSLILFSEPHRPSAPAAGECVRLIIYYYCINLSLPDSAVRWLSRRVIYDLPTSEHRMASILINVRDESYNPCKCQNCHSNTRYVNAIPSSPSPCTLPSSVYFNAAWNATFLLLLPFNLHLCILFDFFNLMLAFFFRHGFRPLLHFADLYLGQLSIHHLPKLAVSS